MESDLKNMNLGVSPKNYPQATPNVRESDDDNLITPAVGGRLDYLITDGGGREMTTESPIMEF